MLVGIISDTHGLMRPEAIMALQGSDLLVVDPVIAGYAAVIFGHSHTPSIETRSGVLWLNPGSAGPRRFKLPITVARMRISGRKIEPVIVEL
jgi:uncharacterized protein